jgi:hypothetical protein
MKILNMETRIQIKLERQRFREFEADLSYLLIQQENYNSIYKNKN